MKIMTIMTTSEEETIRLGEQLGLLLDSGTVISLVGEMGAGKTHFVQGIAKGMGITAVVTSPTFTILNYYEAPVPLQHFDFYRLDQEEELDGLGFDDYIAEGVTLIEWADKFPQRLPAKALKIEIQKKSATERTFVFHIPDNTWSKVEKEVEIYAVSH